MAEKNLDLPDDLVMEILSRLPVKSLVRFKCVAKSWKTIFGTPSFVSNQLSASSVKHKNYPLLLLFAFEKPRAERKTLRLLSNGEPSPNYYKPFVDQHINAIYGPCNGIFLAELTWCLSLWNPATREVEVLPPPTPLGPFPDKRYDKPVYGLGIDAKSIDYKIVKLMSKDPEDCCIWPAIAEVYNVTTDSWRIMNDVPFSHGYTNDVLYANGLHCWTACALYDINGRDGPMTPGEILVRPILCFDVSTETFQEIKPPIIDTAIDASYCGDRITAINNRISYYSVHSISLGTLIEVATMNEYSGAETGWTTSTLTLLCEIPGLRLTVHGCWKDSELILSRYSDLASHPDNILTSYKIDDSESRQVQEIPVWGGKIPLG